MHEMIRPNSGPESDTYSRGRGQPKAQDQHAKFLRLCDARETVAPNLARQAVTWAMVDDDRPDWDDAKRDAAARAVRAYAAEWRTRYERASTGRPVQAAFLTLGGAPAVWHENDYGMFHPTTPAGFGGRYEATEQQVADAISSGADIELRTLTADECEERWRWTIGRDRADWDTVLSAIPYESSLALVECLGRKRIDTVSRAHHRHRERLAEMAAAAAQRWAA